MRKIINSTYISLDGVIENPQNWHVFDDECAEYAQNLLFSCDALLSGRETYASFAEVWPAMEEATGEFGVKMNALDHYVVSDTLTEANWGKSTIIRRDDAVAEIAKLKEQDGENILMYGFGAVSRTLVQNGLLDELRLWINPVIASGGPGDTLAQADFKSGMELTDTKILKNGVIIATYKPTS
ncbi:dihydrofolate reductase family protein [Spirillospora sp. CA-294931]|uniref:dihydrofolate reductase family protein n=1 Tax=Spirillospora sp. CA-294931 TaxID=3240042 RepID=UPI003D8B6D4D